MTEIYNYQVAKVSVLPVNNSINS